MKNPRQGLVTALTVPVVIRVHRTYTFKEARRAGYGRWRRDVVPGVGVQPHGVEEPLDFGICVVVSTREVGFRVPVRNVRFGATDRFPLELAGRRVVRSEVEHPRSVREPPGFSEHGVEHVVVFLLRCCCLYWDVDVGLPLGDDVGDAFFGLRIVRFPGRGQARARLLRGRGQVRHALVDEVGIWGKVGGLPAAFPDRVRIPPSHFRHLQHLQLSVVQVVYR